MSGKDGGTAYIAADRKQRQGIQEGARTKYSP
jgi:hypothetical protein